jgi:hypothetical protein
VSEHAIKEALTYLKKVCSFRGRHHYHFQLQRHSRQSPTPRQIYDLESASASFCLAS